MNDLRGPIPDTLGRLTSLTFLDLSYNNFNDSMLYYSLCNLSSLVYIDLSSTSRRGAIPHCLGNLASLSILRLNENYLQGPIPSEMGNMTQLAELDLSWNAFQGPIPSEMGNMIQLTELELSWNAFQGPIPSEMGNMTQLTKLDISSNAFEGEIPNSMRNLCNLRVLDLSNNKFIGKLSTSIGSPFGCIHNSLEDLSLNCIDDKSFDGDHKHADESKVADETDVLWFYTGIGPGFLGVCGTLNFKKSWRYAYFQFIENNYNWISNKHSNEVCSAKEEVQQRHILRMNLSPNWFVSLSHHVPLLPLYLVMIAMCASNQYLHNP
ncbi:Receptor-like protein 34 [Camellia lanceoleosa]|uniref:Receptor-like protein 34 n=1 Tax=Camellia lanceoleosa TaxID=1840588 RepID=A0ACC0FCB2_9ERIC|nr:Receptor-like protein 34 [Camellia lanceoleosa]